MKLQGDITISKPSYYGDKKIINIRIADKNSHNAFLEVEVDLEKFTEALFGLAHTPCEFSVNNLDVVGKIRETKELVFPVKDTLIELASKKCLDYVSEGWIASTYFGSQNSFRKHEDGKYYAHGTQHRYVESK